MQPDVLRNAAVVGIEIAVTPLVLRISGALPVVPVVVHADGHHVVAAVADVGGQVETDRHRSVLVQTEAVAVDVEVGSLAHAFELDKDLLPPRTGRQAEVLAIPHDGVGQLLDAEAESLVFVEGTGQGDLLPTLVVKPDFSGLRIVAHMEQPFGIEIILTADVLSHGGEQASEQTNQKDSKQSIHSVSGFIRLFIQIVSRHVHHHQVQALAVREVARLEEHLRAIGAEAGMGVVGTHLRVGHKPVAFARTDVYQPDVATEGIARRPTIVAASVAVPEAAANELAVDGLTVFLHFHLAQQLDVVRAQVDAQDAAGLLAEAGLEAQDVEINIVAGGERLVRHPVERRLAVQGLEHAAVGGAEPHALVGIATSFVTEDDFAGREAAGLDVAHLELGVDDLLHAARFEIHLTDTTQRRLYLDGLVALGTEGVLLHALQFFGRAVALDGDVGEVVVAVHGEAAGTAHLAGEGADGALVVGRTAYAAAIDVSEEAVEVHDGERPLPVATAADEHAIGLAGQVDAAQVGALGGLDDAAGGHFDEEHLRGRPAARLAVGRRGLLLGVTGAGGRAEYEVLPVGRPHRIGLVEEAVVLEGVGQYGNRAARLRVHVGCLFGRGAVAELGRSRAAQQGAQCGG